MQEYDDLLKPLLPNLPSDAATNSYRFQWEAGYRKACVDILLTASKIYHSPSVHIRFKKAVMAEISSNGFVEPVCNFHSDQRVKATASVHEQSLLLYTFGKILLKLSVPC